MGADCPVLLAMDLGLRILNLENIHMNSSIFSALNVFLSWAKIHSVKKEFKPQTADMPLLIEGSGRTSKVV